jgi:uncharacterized protein
MTNSNRVVHFEVQADNIERAIKFYKEVFNWKIDMIMKKGVDGETMDYWSITTGKEGTPGINGGMYLRGEDKHIYTFECTINVADIDKAINAVKDNGGSVLVDKVKLEKVGWFANVVDTEGNMFGLMQPTMN